MGAKGRTWPDLFAGVHERPFCAQRAAQLSTLIHTILLSFFGYAVNFAVKREQENTVIEWFFWTSHSK
jgi:hypothetical protein